LTSFIPKTAFGDDSEEDHDMLAQEPELDDQQPQDTGQGNSADDPPSESRSTPRTHPVPESDFDMIDFMHQSAAYNMQQVLQQAEDLPPIPPHVFSERSGGEARRVMLKSRTSTITRSVSEVFAYSTSRTISAQDTAVVLETFGNVSKLLIFMLRLLMLLIILIVLIIFIFTYGTYYAYFTYCTYCTYSLNSTQAIYLSGQIFGSLPNCFSVQKFTRELFNGD
jgi:hypothetical protein